jgi:hypothetical protein
MNASTEWELDLKYGYHWIFKEEVLVTMIELPNLILLPMRGIGYLVKKKWTYIEPTTISTERNTIV